MLMRRRTMFRSLALSGLRHDRLSFHLETVPAEVPLRYPLAALEAMNGSPRQRLWPRDALLQAGLKQAVLFPVSADGDAKTAILRTIEFLS